MNLKQELNSLLIRSFDESELRRIEYNIEFSELQYKFGSMSNVSICADLIVKHVVANNLWNEIFDWIKSNNHRRHNGFVAKMKRIDWGNMEDILRKFDHDDLISIINTPLYMFMPTDGDIVTQIIVHTEQKMIFDLLVFIEELKLQRGVE